MSAYRTEAAWTKMGDDACRQDWRDGNRAPCVEADIESALAGHFDVDLHDPEITEQADGARGAAIEAATRGYLAEYARLSAEERGRAWQVGDHVEGGVIAHEYDTGRIVDERTTAAGREVEVQWSTDVTEWCPAARGASRLRPEGARPIHGPCACGCDADRDDEAAS